MNSEIVLALGVGMFTVVVISLVAVIRLPGHVW